MTPPDSQPIYSVESSSDRDRDRPAPRTLGQRLDFGDSAVKVSTAPCRIIGRAPAYRGGFLIGT